MATKSNELARISTATKNSLEPLKRNYKLKAAEYRRLAEAVGPLNAAAYAAKLQQTNAQSQEAVRELRAEIEQLVEKLEQRAKGPKVEASESTKTSIVRMFDQYHGDVQSVCQWILATEKQDGFAALRDILREISYDKTRLEAMTNVPTSERTPERWMAQHEPVILAHERRVMQPAQVAALAELEAVKAQGGWLLKNLDDAEAWLADSLKGGHMPEPQFTDWYEMPEPAQPAAADYTVDNRSWG